MTDAPAGPPGAAAGLTDAEAAARAARGEVNRAPRARLAEYRDILGRNLVTLYNLLVVPAAVALFLLGEWRGAVAVSGFALLNTAAGLVQEVRAKRHLDRLTLLAEPPVRVVRGERVRTVPAGEVVRGDVLLLAAGDPVVADGAVLESRGLEVDEALLTGESDPVPAPPGRPLLSGSVCVAGDGRYRANRVGPDAYAHRTGAEARRYAFQPGPLQRLIDRLIRILTGTAVALSLGYLALAAVRPLPPADLAQMVAATVTSTVPQGLVLFTTLALTLGAVRLAARGAVPQRLGAVEAMAAVDTLCVDKTGTLTTNRLVLEQVRAVGSADEGEARRLLGWFAAASGDDRNKTVQAVRAALGSAAPVEVLERLPFKSENRYSAARLVTPAGDLTLVLGACEALRPFIPAERGGRWEAAWGELLGAGLRVLMLARADGPPPVLDRRLSADVRLAPVAVIGLSDEVRPDAAPVLAELAAQGIRTRIISGDHPDTVLAVAARLRLPLGPADVVTGDELAAATDPTALLERGVFARVSPRQKVEIVEGLQRCGHRVAMIGDGVNDVLAIKRADLGVAMGDGSPAARTVAGLVLEGDRFELLPAALAEGRNVLRNIRRAGKVFLVKNVYTLLLIVAALGVFGLPFPYLPQQVTLLNKLTIGVPVLVITASRTSAARAGHAGFLRSVGRFALVTGLATGLAGLAALLVSAWWLDDPVLTQRTVLLSTLILIGLGTLPRVLTAEGERLTATDRRLLGWVPAAGLLYALAMYWPPAADFFRLAPLDATRWGLVCAASAAALLAARAADRPAR